MTIEEQQQTTERHAGREAFGEYSLLDALLNRRSRRFSRGMQIEAGPNSYQSPHPPEPLTEEEQALLVFAACGITGAALVDWSYAPGTGGQMMARSVGRTVSSGDAVQTVSLFVMDDDATWLARRPQDMEPELLAEVIELTRDEQFVAAWRKMRVKIADERVRVPLKPPYNLNANRWSLYSAGTTYFLPVVDFTYAAINFILDLLSEDSGMYILDDRRMFRAAGLDEFAMSNGGHLDDDPRNGKTLTLGMAERMGAEFLVVEMGMMLQNLGLACQALGLSGFPHVATHDEAWFEALGFRMEEMPLSEFMAVPLPATLVLKATGKDTSMGYPVGLERDGEVLLKSYAPPYYPSMEEAVHAVVADKYGPGGIYGGGERGVFAHRDAEAGWEDPERLGEGVPRISQAAIAATVAVLTYGWEEYGRFPTTYPPFHTLMGFQAGHIDESYYDEHFREGSLSESHRRHMERWH